MKQKNDETEIEIREAVDSLLENENPAEEAVLLEDMSQIKSTRPVFIQDEELNSRIRSLNDEQRKSFDLVHCWAKISEKKNIFIGTNCNRPSSYFSHMKCWLQEELSDKSCPSIII